MKRYLEIAIVATLLLIAGLKNAHAYIDPGSGSMIMTAILGFLAAIGYTARKYFYKIKSFFCRSCDSKDNDKA